MKKIYEFNGEYDFLSNFYHSEIKIEGIIYPTAEHAFQALKSVNMTDRIKIAHLDTPGQAKRAGQKVQLRPDWENIKTSIMKQVLIAKFIQNPDLGEKLLATKGFTLEEGNTWNDRVWGICPPKTGYGENRLGKLLMEIREKIK
jgi:ribA/ribD-fused uncharacterized protein